MTSKSSALT